MPEWVLVLIRANEWTQPELLAAGLLCLAIGWFAVDAGEAVAAAVRRWRLRRRPIRHIQQRESRDGYSDPALRPHVRSAGAVAAPGKARGPARVVDVRTTGLADGRPVAESAAVPPHTARQSGARMGNVATLSGRVHRGAQRAER